MKTAEIRELTVAEIAERIETEKANLLRAKLNHAVSPGGESDHIEEGA